MNINNYCNKILAQYGEYVNKEQMYKICHISKKTCLRLLSDGLVPCIDTGKTTHRYLIRSSDIVEYLQERERNPESLAADYIVIKQYKSGHKILGRDAIPSLREYYEEISSYLPDVLDVNDVSEFTGYTVKTVRRWCRSKKLSYFTLGNKYLIPLEYLINFMVGNYYLTILQKSQKSERQIATFCRRYYKLKA